MNISKKWKNLFEISSFYTSVTKIMIICYIVPEIWHVTDVIVIFHFGLFLPFYPCNSPKNENFKKMEKTPGDIIILDIMLYCSWDMVHEGCNCYFSFWLFFAFLPPNRPKNQNFRKWKKMPGDIILLHMCTINFD